MGLWRRTPRPSHRRTPRTGRNERADEIAVQWPTTSGPGTASDPGGGDRKGETMARSTDDFIEPVVTRRVDLHLDATLCRELNVFDVDSAGSGDEFGSTPTGDSKRPQSG